MRCAEPRSAEPRPASIGGRPRSSPAEFKEIAVEIAHQSETSAGRVAIGWWRVTGRVLTLRYGDEREMTRILRADEDPERVARQMLRADWGDSGIGHYDPSAVDHREALLLVDRLKRRTLQFRLLRVQQRATATTGKAGTQTTRGGSLGNGGSDGARTRDLRRDKPALI